MLTESVTICVSQQRQLRNQLFSEMRSINYDEKESYWKYEKNNPSSKNS